MYTWIVGGLGGRNYIPSSNCSSFESVNECNTDALKSGVSVGSCICIFKRVNASLRVDAENVLSTLESDLRKKYGIQYQLYGNGHKKQDLNKLSDSLSSVVKDWLKTSGIKVWEFERVEIVRGK